ncbi:MAG: 50S ribosomal protein L5 [Planctomycetota bacterium]|jgi:large subunit ribosomal protein L5
MSRLREKYREEVMTALMERFGIENRMAVPRIEKITVNMGVGRATENRKFLDDAARDLTQITGQKPKVTASRRSVAGFKVREGNPVGCAVTLRGKRMYEFLDRLISIVIPRIRDFRGLSPRAFDGRGNYSMGLSEQIVFPEIDLDSIEHTQGMNVTITVKNATDEMSFELLKGLGMPFRTN